jgi:hypothetical protein
MRSFFVRANGSRSGLVGSGAALSFPRNSFPKVIAMRPYQQIKTCFERIGARVGIGGLDRAMPNRRRLPLAMDVVHDEQGERFDIQLASNVRLAVLDVQPKTRHLLLSASNAAGEDRFLCGHDELHWFVAGLPQVFGRGAESVLEARQNLKPDLVVRLETKRRRGKHPRRSDVFLRQGEWFFLPWSHARIDDKHVTRNGVLARGPGSKPHVCEQLYEDGEREYQCDRYPKLAFFESEYLEILRTRRKANRWNWRPLPYRGEKYARGWISHADHRPLYLDIWHRVELNKETHVLTMSQMVYRD